MIVLKPKIRIEDWPAERQLLGLVEVRKEVIRDAEGVMRGVEVVLAPLTSSGEQVCVEGDVMDQARRAESKPKSPTGAATPRNKLAFRLARLHEQAQGAPGVPQRIPNLGSGLRVDMIVGKDGMTRLLLARERVYPGLNEWATVLANFPYDPPADIEVEKFQHRTWFCLRSEWKTP